MSPLPKLRKRFPREAGVYKIGPEIERPYSEMFKCWETPCNMEGRRQCRMGGKLHPSRIRKRICLEVQITAPHGSGPKPGNVRFCRARARPGFDLASTQIKPDMLRS